MHRNAIALLYISVEIRTFAGKKKNPVVANKFGLTFSRMDSVFLSETRAWPK